MRIFYLSAIVVLFLSGCATSKKNTRVYNKPNTAIKSTVVIKEAVPVKKINTKNVDPSKLVTYAESLEGTPYRYGSAVPKNGLDCSGFVYHVFNKFNISVPRVSKDFTNAGEEVSTLNSRRGDIILFTGSNEKSGVVGHMGIITENRNGVLRFIHSASGNNGGVMTSGMNSYFIPRFVKVIRVFKAA